MTTTNLVADKLRSMAKKAESVFDESFYNPWLEAAKEIDRLYEKIIMVHEIMMPKPPGDFDLNDGMKIQGYNELRRKLYPDNR